MVVRMEVERYAELRKEFLKVAKFHIKDPALDELKWFYEEPINSVRALYNIDDIEELVRILEKRGVIRYNQIAPLRYIAVKYLSNSVIKEKLDVYEAWLKNYNDPYLPQSNLYRCKNGECYSQNRNTNDHNSFHDYTKSSSKYKLPCVELKDINQEDDFSDSNNSKLSISSSGTGISVKNNFNCKNNNNKFTNTRQDFEICVVSRKMYNVDRNQESNVVSAVQVPFNILSEHRTLLHSTTEDLDNNDSVCNISLIPTPQLVEPQTIASPINSDISHHSLNRSRTNKNVRSYKDRLKELIAKKYFKIFITITILVLVLLFMTLFSVYDLSKNPVHYNPKPTAPSSQVSYPGQSSGSTHSYPGYNTPRNQDDYNDYTLENLSTKERELQERVFRLVSRDLGRFWRDVARCLQVRESDINDIDDINSPYKDFQQKAHAALKKFATETDPSRWKLNLKKGLRSGRRNDLADKVDNLLSRTQ